jgi:hypothetical protein
MVPMFPTSSPMDISEDCINMECVVGSDDCSCVPGLECRQRSDGQGGIAFLCSAVSKMVKNRISDGEGIGGAAGRNPDRERVTGNRFDVP